MKFIGFSLLFTVSTCLVAADIGVVEEIIAKVNGDIITRTEVDHGRKQLEGELRQRGASGAVLQKELEERGKDVLRDRIDQLLLVQKGKELNINVDPDVSKNLAEIQLQSKIADSEKFSQYVREQTGQSLEDYKADMRNGLLTQRVIRQEVGKSINIPKAEVAKYYQEHKNEFVREEQVFLREILVSTEGKDAPGIAVAEKKAKDLVARARKGEKFGELARDNSDAATKANYGELGAFKRGELNPQVEKVIFTQERGYVTDPVRIPNGFLILKLEERHKAGQATLEEVDNEIMEKLYMPRMQPKVREYLTQLREEAFLEIKPGFIDTGAAPKKNTAWQDPAQLKPETITKEEVSSRVRKRRLLGVVPVPGTEVNSTSTSKSR